MQFLEKLKPLALLLLRWALAVIFIYHGWPKLFGKTQIFIQAFEGLGLPAWSVYAVGIVELFGGGLLVLGLFTRAAGLLLMLDMIGAMWKYNLGEGFRAVREYELPLALCAAAFALATIGAGAISLDQLIYGKRARVKSKGYGSRE